MKATLLIVTIIVFSSISVSAHVPYFEHFDYTEDLPFFVRKSVDQSKAIYAWLKFDNQTPCTDIDVFRFKIKQPIQMYFELIVPAIEDYYFEFVPWYALVGPGLPPPNQTLPFEIPQGYGAIVMENVEPGEERETFYEPFGGKYYYEGPILELNLTEEGVYYVYCWDPYQSGGDYVMVIGKKELFGPLDIIRALIYTPLIRRDLELHING